MPIWSIYLLRDETNSLYTGITTDVERRLAEHRQKGRCGAKYTKAKKRLELVYCCELGSRSLASQAEYRVKRMLKEDKETIVSCGYNRSDLLACLGLKVGMKRISGKTCVEE
jgi:putative endonuclease